MSKAHKTISTSNALGQLYGYGIQEARFFHHLLRAEVGDSVALEYLDDVSGKHQGESFAEQDKSGLAHNPISDRAIDLWKTFATWIEGRRSGRIPPGTKFILYVAQPYRGKIAEGLSACQTAEEAKQALKQLREAFWGTKPTYEKRDHLPEDLAKYVNVVLTAREAAVVDIIRAFTLERGTGAPYDDIAAEVSRQAVGPESVPLVVNQLAGWIKTTVYKQIEKGQPAVLSRETFHNEYVAVVRKFDRSDSQLHSFAEQPTIAQVEAELLNQNYVRQLRLINADETIIYTAINNYLMASADRTEWAKRGYVHRSSFADYEATLCSRWTLLKSATTVKMRGASPEDIGLVLLADCLMTSLPLQDKPVTSYFTPGSFHKLANTLEIGWHPEFTKLMSTAGVDADVT